MGEESNVNIWHLYGKEMELVKLKKCVKELEEMIRFRESDLTIQSRIYDFHVKEELQENIMLRENFEKEFYLEYQPQVCCHEGYLLGVEALLRWKQENGRLVPPTEFIPIMEENGMIIPLGYWIIEQAAKQLSAWYKKGFRTIRMAVNVSSKQLEDDYFVCHLKKIIKKYRIKKSTFEIEITENVKLENNIKVQDTLSKIKSLGISIAMDDFGTGYSSLYYLKNYPINRLKIAKEIIDQIETDTYAKSIVQMIITMASLNNFRVLAEGVETMEQWTVLRGLSCDEIQGFLFSKPLQGDELEQKWMFIEHSKEILLT